MKKFRFTLDRMLDFKNQILDKEKDLLAQIRRKKVEIEEKIDQCENKIAFLSMELAELQEQGTTIFHIKSYSVQIENSRQYMKQLKKELVGIDAEVERQSAVVRKASQEVSALEKLEERQYEEYLYEEKQRNEAEVLEFVTGRIARDNLKINSRN